MSERKETDVKAFLADGDHVLLQAQFSLFIGGAQWLNGRASDSGARGRGSKHTSAVLCPSASDTLLPESTGNTQEAVAPSRHD